MNSKFVFLFLFAFLAYIIIVIMFLEKRRVNKEILNMIDKNTKFSGVYETSSTKNMDPYIKTMAFEDSFLKKLGMRASEAVVFLYIERIVILITIGFILFLLRGLGLAAVLAVAISYLFDDMYKKMVYNSGVTNIPRLVSFINFFVPQLNSGVSADQALTVYIQTNSDEELSEYYKNKGNPNYKIPVHLRQIIDVYDLALYNERLGVGDYTYILMEMSEDINQKSSYYNKFLGSMGEIKPIGYSFTFGVPLFILISYSQTQEFWKGPFGWIAGLAVIILFALYKFLIFKLQDKTVKKIF